MTNDHDELRTRFAHLREYDQATAPQFRVAQSRQPNRPARVWLAAAALLVVAPGVVLRQTLSQRGLTPVEPSVSITTWRSPTASLLRPATQLQTAAILSSVLDGAAASSIRTTGDSR